MACKMTSSWPVVATFLLMAMPQTLAHTWNEQIALIASDGNFTGPYGYSRGYVARTIPGFNDDMMTYLLPPDGSNRTRIDSQDLLCAPTQQTANQTSGYPRLQVAPGSQVAMKYLENGHVTEPYVQPGKPPKAGTVYVFGTTQSNSQETLMNVMQWNSEGTGGDKRGVLLAAENFDDGRCHQINSSPMSLQRQQEYPDPTPGQPGTKNELWCETDITIPKTGLSAGQVYTVYWVWQWPTAPGADPTCPDGKDEYYTTCSDFDVVAQAPSGAVTNTLIQQDPMPSADAEYLSRTALTPTPSVYQASAPTVAAQTTILPSSAAISSTLTTAVVASSIATTITAPSSIVMTAGIPSSIIPTATSLSSTAAGAEVPSSITPTDTIPSLIASTAEVPSPSILSTATISSMMATTTAAPSSIDTTAAIPTANPVPNPSTTHMQGHHATKAGEVFTATIYVTAVLPPGQDELIVQGTHRVTFIRPSADKPSSGGSSVTPTGSTTRSPTPSAINPTSSVYGRAFQA